MREKNIIIIWTIYFDSQLTKKEGRRVPIRYSVSSPLVNEIIEVCKKRGIEVIRYNNHAKYPRCWWREAGYIVIKKDTVKKRNLLIEIAKELRRKRGLM